MSPHYSPSPPVAALQQWRAQLRLSNLEPGTHYLPQQVTPPSYSSDLIPRVSNYCLREWQEIWSNCVNNKLYAIYQTVLHAMLASVTMTDNNNLLACRR